MSYWTSTRIHRRDIFAVVVLILMFITYLIYTSFQDSDYEKVMKHCEEKNLTKEQCDKAIDIFNQANPDNQLKKD
jgi:hypothetical protein